MRQYKIKSEDNKSSQTLFCFKTKKKKTAILVEHAGERGLYKCMGIHFWAHVSPDQESNFEFIKGN